jgi:hypothetical protein
MHDAHDTGLANKIPMLVSGKNCGHQTRPVLIQLFARIPKSGDFDDRRFANVKSRASRQPQQLDASGQDVLSNRARAKPESRSIELVQQLVMEQVDLS